MAADPEISAITAICAALGELGSDEARQRVLDFAASKFKLKSSKKTDVRADSDEAPTDDGEFFARFDHAKPFKAVYLLTARHYHKFGTQPFSVVELKKNADAAGLTVPTRIDKTLISAGSKGKKYYQQLESGKFRVTVHGENFLKTTYKVKKGVAQSSAAEI